MRSVCKALLKKYVPRKIRSDKCKKVGFVMFCQVFVAYASLLQWVVKFGARLCQSSAILVHSWDISFSILAHFTQCWGGFSWRYVGSDWGRGGWIRAMLKALLLLRYLFCGHVGPLGCFISAPFDFAGGLLRTVRKAP